MLDITTAGLRVFANALQRAGGAAGGIVDNSRRVMRVVANSMNHREIYAAFTLGYVSLAGFTGGVVMLSTDSNHGLGAILCLAGPAGFITSVELLIHIIEEEQRLIAFNQPDG